MSFSNELNDDLITFINEQHIYFTGSAPKDGRVNISPKGTDSFRCFDKKTVGYLDLTGSGNETAAHIHENGRMTVMFCSFTEKPLILRLYGKGEVVRMESKKWNKLISHFPNLSGKRQIILLHIESVQESCGYSIPYMDYNSERTQLNDAWDERGTEATLEYQEKNNRESIDGLPTHLIDKP